MSFKRLEIPSTAGNVNGDFVVPDGVAYRVLYGQIVISTDATVADRFVLLQILDEGSNVVIDIHPGAPVQASTTDAHLEFMQGIFRETAFIDGALQVPVPIDLWLPSGWTLRIAVSGGVAGDSYSGLGLVDAVPAGRAPNA